MLIQYAYSLRHSRVLESPSWTEADTYDIEAEADDLTSAEVPKLAPRARDERDRAILQSLLRDRFNLAFHRATKRIANIGVGNREERSKASRVGEGV